MKDCGGSCYVTVAQKSALADAEDRVKQLERICEQLEQELADANAIINLVDAESEDCYMEEDYD